MIPSLEKAFVWLVGYFDKHNLILHFAVSGLRVQLVGSGNAAGSVCGVTKRSISAVFVKFLKKSSLFWRGRKKTGKKNTTDDDGHSINHGLVKAGG